MKKNVGLHELYARDAREADRRLWGRQAEPVTRRGFLRGSGLAAMSGVLGATIPFARYFPEGLIPAALAQESAPFAIPGKDGLTVLNDRPINAETPAHLLDDAGDASVQAVRAQQRSTPVCRGNGTGAVGSSSGR